MTIENTPSYSVENMHNVNVESSSDILRELTENVGPQMLCLWLWEVLQTRITHEKEKVKQENETILQEQLNEKEINNLKKEMEANAKVEEELKQLLAGADCKLETLKGSNKELEISIKQLEQEISNENRKEMNPKVEKEMEQLILQYDFFQQFTKISFDFSSAENVVTGYSRGKDGNRLFEFDTNITSQENINTKLWEHIPKI